MSVRGRFSLDEERVIAESVRRAHLQANNNPTFVPPLDDASFILAVKSFATTGVSGGGASGRTLTFGPHLTGSSYNGAVDVTLGTDADEAATPSTLMARDANGHAAAVQLILGVTGFIGDTGAGALDIWPAVAGGHVRVQKSDFTHTNVDIDDDGNMDVRGNLTVTDVAPRGAIAAAHGVGWWGKSPPAQAAAPAAAGATYGATEQAAINDVILRLKNLGAYA